MSTYNFFTADVFTSRRFGGNPLAVLTDACGLDARTMQTIAREFNYSESVFVFPPEKAGRTRQLRIFTPAAELPFAGHPTVGTAFVLAASGEIPLSGETTRIVFEEGVGDVPVAIRAEAGKPVFTQLTAAKMPEIGPTPPPGERLAEVFGLSAGDLLGGEFIPEAISCGIPFLFVAVKSREALGRIRLDRALWERTLANYWAGETFLFAFDPELPGSDLHARMFAPRLGITEDPATGAAATALAGYLSARDHTSSTALRWVVEQGFEMGRPSILEVEAEREGREVRAIRVGGASVLVSRGQIEV
jgi:trans-2,3-dihydro-3-hydroxyanthranilate isomerase